MQLGAVSANAQLQTQPGVNATEAHCTLAGAEESYTFDRLAPSLGSSRAISESDNTVLLSADSAISDPEDPEQILLTGTISIDHSEGRLTAENARYDTRSNVVTVDGKVLYETDGVTVDSTDAEINIEDGTFIIGDSGYRVNSGEATSQGRAETILRDIRGNLRLRDATYSSCPEGNNGWLISSDSIKLDSKAGIGTARDVTLHFKDVPIFYAPVFSFPLSNQRKTGFLTPRLDITDQTGFEYRQPFYWNIRPNWDATFVTRAMSDRGIQLQTEVRHLNTIGSWVLNHEFMSDDNQFTSGANRYFTRFRHLGGLSRRWTTLIDFSSVGDRDYFEDLGDTLNIASITHLQRRADLTYTARNYEFRTRFLSYQTVDEAIVAEDRPYKKLPQLTLDYAKSFADKSIEAEVNAEWVFFDRDNSITGTRLDIKPRVEWNINRKSWFSSVAGSIRHTNYDLRGANSQSRTIPVLSADTGLYFDRFNSFDGSLLTLEPRAYYLYSKRSAQDDIPLFDTGALDFNFSQLFRENRFSGADRINDANQLSLAFSSRLINSEGREKFLAAIGQILYFEDRMVTLPDEEPETSSGSDIVGELVLEFDENWSGETTIQWDPSSDETQRASAAIRYRDGTSRLVNIGHRFIRGEGEFLHASIAWPIKNNWRVASAWNYSLDNKQSIETLLGVEYDSCCWAVRTAARRFITDDGTDTTTSFFIQLVLKGLAPVGQNVGDLLSEAVGGYTANDS